jgi:hypothetical protein
VLRQTAEPNFHLSSIELIDAAENGWSREPQLRVPNWAGKVLRLLGLAQQCHRCACWAVASAQRQNFFREAVALVDAADQPLAAEDVVIDAVLVGAVAKAGWAGLEGLKSVVATPVLA